MALQIKNFIISHPISTFGKGTCALWNGGQIYALREMILPVNTSLKNRASRKTASASGDYIPNPGVHMIKRWKCDMEGCCQKTKMK